MILKNQAPIFGSFVFETKEEAELALCWLLAEVHPDDAELYIYAKTRLYEQSLRNPAFQAKVVEKNYDFDFREYFMMPVTRNIQKAAAQYFEAQASS